MAGFLPGDRQVALLYAVVMDNGRMFTLGRSPRWAAPRTGLIAVEFLLCAVTTGAAPALARQTSRVVVLRMSQCCPKEAWPQAETATVAELRASQFTVVLAPSRTQGKGARRRELIALSRQHRAFCAIRILRRTAIRGVRVDIWIADRMTRKTVWRTISLPNSPDAPSIAALRVLELLLASLQELRTMKTGAQKARILPRRVSRLLGAAQGVSIARRQPRRPGRFGVRLDIGAGGSPGGLGALALAGLTARWSPAGPLALEVQLSSAIVSKHLSAAGESASVNVASATAWALWEICPHGRFRPTVGLGAGVLIPWGTGQDSAAYIGRTHVSASGLFAATAQIAFVMTPELWLRLGFSAGIAVPEVTIQLGAMDAATFARPLLSAFLGFEVHL